MSPDEIQATTEWFKFPCEVHAEIRETVTSTAGAASENVVFTDDVSAQVVKVPRALDSTFHLSDYTDTGLGNFLSRPVMIHDYRWDVGTTFLAEFDPWKEFFDNSVIRPKLDYYNLLRCNLCVKFMVNGNSFYYGKALASYYPNPPAGSSIYSIYGRGLLFESQRPHMFIDTTSSEGGDLCLPFFHPFNQYSIPETSWEGAGLITLRSMMALRNANNSTAPINISVFAWAEDVELTVPTDSTPDPPIELEKVHSEYGSGLISKPASALAAATGKLSSIPVIGPYAKATSLIAGAVSSVAKIFGFSRPPTLTDPSEVRLVYAGNICNSDRPENVTKLALDSKQELTIDPTVVGLAADDEMCVSSLTSRSSYFFQFPWTTAQTAGTQIAGIRVNPCAYDIIPGTHHVEHYRAVMPTMLGFATQPFEYWSGSITYRFQVMASTFHKGRLRIVYDPNPGLGGSYAPTNTTYQRVIDLSQTKDLELTISWGQPQPYKHVTNMITESRSPTGYPGLMFHVGSDSGVAAMQYDNMTDNGVLYVYVLNDLVVPNVADPGNPVVNVYVKGGEDFELSVPTHEHLSDMALFDHDVASTLSASDVAKFRREGKVHSENTESNDVVASNVAPGIMTPQPSNNHKADVFFGESFPSFRTLCRRYQRTYVLDASSMCSSTEASGNRYIVANSRVADFPPPPGYAVNGWSSVNDGTYSWNYNPSPLTLVGYLGPAYAAFRGALRSKVLFGATTTGGGQVTGTTDWTVFAHSNQQGVGEVTRAGPYSTTFENGSVCYGVTDVNGINTVGIPTYNGTALTKTEVQPVLEVETPYYTMRRFHDPRSFGDINGNIPVDTGGFQATTATFTMNFPSPSSTAAWHSNTAAFTSSSTTRYVATGEDFTLMWLLSTYLLYDKSQQLL